MTLNRLFGSIEIHTNRQCVKECNELAGFGRFYFDLMNVLVGEFLQAVMLILFAKKKKGFAFATFAIQSQSVILKQRKISEFKARFRNLSDEFVF
jgi:hypothetical protein